MPCTLCTVPIHNGIATWIAETLGDHEQLANPTSPKDKYSNQGRENEVTTRTAPTVFIG